jgi:Zn ribbon nucleic-acid-binding protein
MLVWLTSVFMIWTVVCTIRAWRLPTPREQWRQDRVRRGLCAKCGYDMRATPARCPECGERAGWRVEP